MKDEIKKWFIENRVNIIISILFMLGIPFLVYILTTCLKMPGIQIFNDWIGFWGSFIPSMFGVLVTVGVLKITTDQTREIQKENLLSEDKREKTRFTEKVAELVGEYAAEICVYYHRCRDNYKLELDIEAIRKNLKEEKNVYRDTKIRFEKTKENVSMFNREEELKKELEIISRHIRRLELRLEEKHHELEFGKRSVNRVKAISIYFTLSIFLDNIKSATGLMKKLDEIHNDKCYKVADVEYVFQDDINELLEIASYFSLTYLSETNK